MTVLSDWRPELDWGARNGGARLGGTLWLVAAITLIGLALRLFHLGHLSLWHDEAMTALYVSMPLDVLWTTPMGSHPPPYYSILKALSVFGSTEIMLRVLSAVAGAATVPVIYAIGKIFGGRAYGLAAAAAMAVSGMHIEYSQEARSYAVAIFFLSLACLYSVRFVVHRHQDGSLGLIRRDLCLYGLFAALAAGFNLATIYYVVALAVVVTVYCLLSDPEFPRWRDMLVPWGYIVATLLVGVFVAGLAGWMTGAASAFQWLTQYSAWSAVGILTDVVGGRHYEVFRTVFRLFLSILCAVGAVVLLRERKFGPLCIVLLFVAVVPVLVWLTGFLKPILMHRTVLPTVIGVTLSIGAFTLLRSRIAASLLLAAFFVPALVNLYGYYASAEKPDWRAVANFIKAHSGDRPTIILCSDNTYWSLDFYRDGPPGPVFAIVADADDSLYELNSARLRDIKSKKIVVPTPLNTEARQKIHAAQWPDIKSSASLTGNFDEIWLIDGHCFTRGRKQAMDRLRNRLEAAGFVQGARSNFFENGATRYTRKGAAPK